MKEQKETFADICAEFIGKPYSELGFGPDSYGCVGLCYAFLKRRGKIIDESVWEYEGLTLTNYMERWKHNHSIDGLLLKSFDRIGTEISIKKRLAGDLLVIQAQDGSYFPAIYVGNNNFMASFADRGVMIFAMANNLKTVKTRRL
jgi:cell wall-associated NlpC family hydrolase